MHDFERNTGESIASVDPTPMFRQYPNNPLGGVQDVSRHGAKKTSDAMTPAWVDRLDVVDVFTADNAFAMLESLRIDYDVLGLFSIHH